MDDQENLNDTTRQQLELLTGLLAKVSRLEFEVATRQTRQKLEADIDAHDLQLLSEEFSRKSLRSRKLESLQMVLVDVKEKFEASLSDQTSIIASQKLNIVRDSIA
ncbi:hypothetical protein BKA62DRAFT_671756 [Auriculariales sp. MPI-PUGE-AT-0066]|nr:hypothetical protein BKA62DRAFT_671756 [Auriculariales sp. MPI-PUGE-AT-0066]